MATHASPAAGPDEVIEAMRSIHSESDRWHLAEALFKKIPSGLQGFQEIIDKASAEGVAGNLSVNTLRLYRDTASRWPANKRVADVSFSGHREVMALPGTVDGQAKLLSDLVRQHGAGSVTIKTIRDAVKVKQGKSTATKSAAGKSGAPNQAARQMVDVLDDIMKGSPKLIASIVVTTSTSELERLQAGLNKAIGHVEKLRMKAQRSKDAAKKVAAKPAVPTKSAPAGKAIPKKAAGNLRGL